MKEKITEAEVQTFAQMHARISKRIYEIADNLFSIEGENADVEDYEFLKDFDGGPFKTVSVVGCMGKLNVNVYFPVEYLTWDKARYKNDYRKKLEKQRADIESLEEIIKADEEMEGEQL